MARPKRLVNRKQVSFSVSEAEYKWIELQASGNISHWCREQILADHPIGTETVQETEDVKAAEPVKKEREHKAKEPVRQKCRHGLFFCYTCQEIASAES